MNRLLYFRLAGAFLTVALCFPLTKHLGIFGTALGTSIALSCYFLLLSFSPGGALSLLLSARRAAIGKRDSSTAGNPRGDVLR